MTYLKRIAFEFIRTGVFVLLTLLAAIASVAKLVLVVLFLPSVILDQYYVNRLEKNKPIKQTKLLKIHGKTIRFYEDIRDIEIDFQT